MTGTSNAESSLTLVTVLRAASQLFAAQGYEVTTMEDIAAHAGVSLVKAEDAFASPEMAMRALLEHDIDKALESAEAEETKPDPAVVRIFRYLANDLTWVLASPYDLMGIDRRTVLDRPEFGQWMEKMLRLRDIRLNMIRQAIEEGDFMGVRAEFAQEAMTSIIMGTLEDRRGSPVDNPLEHGLELASLAIRSLLKDTSRIDSIRSQAGF